MDKKIKKKKKIDADPKAIQQIEFVGQLKKKKDNGNATNAGGNQNMFVLVILEIIKETKLKFSQRGIIVLQKMGNPEEVRVKLTNNQLQKHVSAANN